MLQARTTVLYGLAGQSRKIAYQLGFFGIQLLQRYKREAAYRNPLVPHQTPHTLYTLHNKVCLSPFSCIPVLIFSFLVMFAMAMGDTRFASVAVRA